MGTRQRDESILELEIHGPISTCDYVTEISNVSFFIIGATMGLLLGIEVRTSTDTTVGVVSKLVDMEAMLACESLVLIEGDLGKSKHTRCEAFDVDFDGDRTIVLLTEPDDT
jgi:hypothetical protein